MATNPHDIVPAHLAVQAMRDNGYKNAAYAIAELMDNSIQAGATQVELLCGEKKQQVGSRMRSRIHQIAVLDNGSGMDSTVLRLALQFGNGTHLEEEKHKGIGRFGMGLPSSSVSQCQKVEVWTWQDGVENALYSYLDLNEIKTQRINEVPAPESKPIPSIWQQVGNNYDRSGTLVVWSDIDRCMWKTGKTIIDNSELLIGRMYRKFLNAEKVTIRMLAFDLDNPNTVITEKYALPNDPGYLMAKTSCPSPFNNQSMFQPWEEAGQYETVFTIDFRDRQHEVKVRFSYAKEEARQASGNKNPGDLPHGKHAAKNIGVSVVRAGRELDLDQSLVIKYDPTERWWGIEVEFPPSLDDLFGVTNNKQSARNFAELINIDIESMLQGGKTIVQLKEELKDDEDPREPLLEIALKINTQLSTLRRLIKAQRKGTRPKNNRYPGSTPERQATRVTENRKQDGYKGESDKDESLPALQRQTTIQQTLTEAGVTENQAKELAATTISDNLKYVFVDADLDNPAFFSVKPKGGAIVITLNTKHPAYENLVEILENEVENVDTETLRSRLAKSRKGLKLSVILGTELSDLCAEANQEVLLVAPFIKASVLERLLDEISSDVFLKCITRWFPEEIVAGVSDLEVWNLIQNRPNSSLWLRSDLHAKYYRADNRCLVGSANLTGKALGWSNCPNLELLVTLPANEPTVKTFDTELLKACIPVTEDLFEQMSLAVQLLAEQAPNAIATSSRVEIPQDNMATNDSVNVNAWLPTLRNPEDLYLAYSGEIEKLSTASKIAALTDLRSLPIIPNLSQKTFKAYIGTLLFQKPIIQKIDSFVKTPQRFGAVKNLLNSLPCVANTHFNAERAWQTLMRWLLYFLPNRYALSVPNYSEVFYRIKTS